MKVSNNFYIQEFVPPEIYERYGDSSIWFINKKIVLLTQFVRDRHGKPVIANNWHTGGNLKNRGFRMPNCKVGGKLSQHKFANAVDYDIVGMTADEQREDQKKNFDLYSKYGLTTIEENVRWNHNDCRNTNSEELFIVYP